jgi:undecaprenyl diphosphate synthase
MIPLEDLSEETFEARLATGGMTPPDLIIRTSGEQRLSNFLLWEAAYAEFVFQDIYWPDYGPEPLKAAVEEYQRRTRRYGGADVDDVLATG